MTDTEVIVFPDAVQTCRAYLEAALAEAGDTDTEIADRIGRAIRQATLRLVNTEAVNLVVQRSTIEVAIRTGDDPTAKEEAHDLGQLLHALLFAMNGTTQPSGRVYNVADADLSGIAGLSDEPDPVTGKPRYTFGIAVSMRGTAL